MKIAWEVQEDLRYRYLRSCNCVMSEIGSTCFGLCALLESIDFLKVMAMRNREAPGILRSLDMAAYGLTNREIFLRGLEHYVGHNFFRAAP